MQPALPHPIRGPDSLKDLDYKELMVSLEKKLAEGMGPAKFAQEFKKIPHHPGASPLSSRGGERMLMSPLPRSSLGRRRSSRPM